MIFNTMQMSNILRYDLEHTTFQFVLILHLIATSMNQKIVWRNQV